MIEQLYPTAPKIELFARGTPAPGGDAWGEDRAIALEPDASHERRSALVEREWWAITSLRRRSAETRDLANRFLLPPQSSQSG